MEFLLLLIPVGFAAVGIAGFVFWVSMLVHCIKHDHPDKILWAILIVLLSLLGAVLYRLIQYPKVEAGSARPACAEQ